MKALQLRSKPNRDRRRGFRPSVDSLESRVTLSASPVLGSISGQVTNVANGKPMPFVKVQLLDSHGTVVQTTTTNLKGKYVLKVRENGPLVVREVLPRHFSQTTPTFRLNEPEGPTLPGTYSYNTGNSDPTLGPVGPYAWDTIAPAGDLPFQSPINIKAPTIDLNSVLTVNYNPAVSSQAINNGHQIQVQFPANNPSDTVTVGGTVFNLAQFHYHDPSETTVNHHGYSMEEHFVNTSATGGETVVAVFLQLGAHNNALDPILNAATSSLTTSGSKTTIPTPINFAGLLPTNTQGWYYEGSLTTPPLAQPVNWFVYATPITLDHAQLIQYEKVAAGAGFLPSNRPIQPTDGRVLNEIDYDVNFQGQSMAGLNFGLKRTS